MWGPGEPVEACTGTHAELGNGDVAAGIESDARNKRGANGNAAMHYDSQWIA